MLISILDLPNEILLDIFCRYVSVKDLCRLEQVCKRFRGVLKDTLPWKKALARLTNVSFSQLKNAAGCPAFEVRYKHNKFQELLFSFFLEYSSFFFDHISSISSSNRLSI